MVGGLEALGAEVVIHDPFVDEYKGDLKSKAAGCDAAMIMVRHNEYLSIDIPEFIQCLKSPIIIDGRRVFDPQKLSKAGIDYSSIGFGG